MGPRVADGSGRAAQRAEASRGGGTAREPPADDRALDAASAGVPEPARRHGGSGVEAFLRGRRAEAAKER